MKGKYISALMGIGAAAILAVPGVASASTAGQPRHALMPTVCRHLHVPWYDQGRKVWLLVGHGRHARCLLVTIPGHGHGHGGHAGQHGG